MASMPELGVGPNAPAAGATTRSLRLRQTATVLLLFGGYGALYFCRADLSVATPMLADELGKHGVSHGDAIICIGTQSAVVQPRVDRQPPDTIACVGGAHQSLLEMVRLLVLRNDHRHPEHQLPRGRRGGAPMDGNAHRAWLRLARAVLLRRRGGRSVLGVELFLSSGIAPRCGIHRGETESAESVRRIGIPAAERGSASAALVPQPRLHTGLLPVPGLHDNLRVFQLVDPRVSARLPGL